MVGKCGGLTPWCDAGRETKGNWERNLNENFSKLQGNKGKRDGGREGGGRPTCQGTEESYVHVYEWYVRGGKHTHMARAHTYI